MPQTHGKRGQNTEPQRVCWLNIVVLQTREIDARRNTSTFQQFSTCVNLHLFSISQLGPSTIVEEEELLKIPLSRLQFTSIKQEIRRGVQCLVTLFVHCFFSILCICKEFKVLFFIKHVTKQTIRSSSFVQSFRNIFSQHIYPKRLLSSTAVLRKEELKKSLILKE